MANITERDMICDRCGGTLEHGYEIRDCGIDRQTGYHDEEYVCAQCLDGKCYHCRKNEGEKELERKGDALWLCISCYVDMTEGASDEF